MIQPDAVYDVMIIGKGPAGISASLYTLRAGLSTIVISKGGESLGMAEKIGNYYGVPGDSTGADLLDAGVAQAKALGAVMVEDEIAGLDAGDVIELTGMKGIYRGRSLILGMGAPKKKFKAVNLDKFEGRGISYCGICDGFFYKGKKIGVVGNKDYMAHEAMDLLNISDNLTILTNGMEIELEETKPGDINGLKIYKDQIKGFFGDEFLQGVEFASGRKEHFDGIFIAYGSASAAELAKKAGIMTENGVVVVDESQRTNIAGIFAAGDCTGGFRQVAVAVGEGAVAAKSVIEHLRSIRTSAGGWT
ncbi:MAG: NAD(P)/FAD-dependent oxidoreductase [Clostridia bacterium]|nr:NAD(P)/FAD-dependent oxidoreductase [Clostridia bacterium]